MTGPSFDAVAVGDTLPPAEIRLTRADLVRYCGASGDFNVIHWNERIAKAVGLPDVIAHGMLTMGAVGRVLTAWAGDPGAVVDYGTRFSAPVVVPDDDQGALVSVTGEVTEKNEDGTVTVLLTARVGETGVLSRCQARVRLA